MLKQYSNARFSSRATMANVTLDDSMINTHKNLEELMNQNQIQNQRHREQSSLKTPEAPLNYVLNCMSCLP